jgi:hypothetical protein
MNRRFEIGRPFRVPDGTLVAPFLNPSDSASGLPSSLLSGFSVAAGTIESRCRSRIQVMPFVTMVTFVLRGHLAVIMKGSRDVEPYRLEVTAEQAVLTEPNTLLQLANETGQECAVLYIVSPAYVFEKVNDEVVFDDSVVMDETWDELDYRGRPLPHVTLALGTLIADLEGGGLKYSTTDESPRARTDSRGFDLYEMRFRDFRGDGYREQ